MKDSAEFEGVPEPGVPAIAIKVVGVGSAGGNAVAQMAKLGFAGVRFAAVNTHARALATCEVPEKHLLAGKLRRGLGTGGDPEQGRTAAEADLEPLRRLCEGADIVFIVAGMGGGTGTGAAPILARLAKESGALVLAIVTLPFDWEGPRRQRQAQLGVQLLKAIADGVICIPNQRIFQCIDETTSVLETLDIINDMVAEGVRSVWRMLTQPGLIRIDFADLCAVAQGRHAESILLTAQASGPGRARELVERVLAHPLVQDGRALSEADALLVSLVGGPGLTMAEVNRVMEQIQRQCENSQMIVGAAVEENAGDTLSISLVASRRQPAEACSLKIPSPAEPECSVGNGPGRTGPPEFESQFFRSTPDPRPPSRFVPPPPPISAEQQEQILARNGGLRGGAAKKPRLEQVMLPLEVISKGRFEKSEPTVYRGEDLDIPTYVRRGVALN